MKTTTLTSLMIVSLALGACSDAKTQTTSAPDINAETIVPVETKTKAVLVYADWCGSCKVLDPKIKKVQAMGPMPGLEFVTLDYTAKDADNFYAQAEAAGVGEAVRVYLDGTVKTGQLLLVDIDDKKVVGKVTKTLEHDEIITVLKTAVSAS